MGIESVSHPTRLLTAAAVAAVTAGAFATPAAAAGIELGEGLSVTGFVDMSFLVVDPDGGSSSKTFGIDQVEMDFMYAGSNGVSAQVDIEYGESSAGDPDDDTTFVEQAFITKKFNDQFSIKAGRFLSYTGWETEEPTGLFQYSGAGYAPFFYGYYQQGVSAAYDGEMFDVMGTVFNSAFDPLERNTDGLGYELGVAVTPVEGLTAKVFYTVNNYDGTSAKDKVLNTWVSYAVAGFTFAAEYNDADYADPNEKGDGFLLMANYASGPWGITARYHDWDIKNAGVSVNKVKGFTISPSYKVGDNLLLVSEFRTDDVSGGGDVNSFALEALFTF
jgi:hypothetical protein